MQHGTFPVKTRYHPMHDCRIKWLLATWKYETPVHAVQFSICSFLRKLIQLRF